MAPPRAAQAMTLIRRGLSVSQVAKQMGIAKISVYTHLRIYYAEEFRQLRASKKNKRSEQALSLVARGLSFRDIQKRLNISTLVLAQILTADPELTKKLRDAAIRSKRERAWAYYLKYGTIEDTAKHFGVNESTIVRWFHRLHGPDYKYKARSSSILKVANEYLTDKHLSPNKLRELREWVGGLDVETLARDIDRSYTRPVINERLVEDQERRMTPLLGRMIASL